MDLVFDIVEMILKLVWLIGITPAAVFFVRKVAARPETEHHCSRSGSTDTELCRKHHMEGCLQTRTVDDPTPRLKHLVPAFPMALLWPLMFASIAVLHVAGGTTRSTKQEVTEKQQREFELHEVQKINADYEEALKIGPYKPDVLDLAERCHDLQEKLQNTQKKAADDALNAGMERQELQAKVRRLEAASENRWLAPDPPPVPLGEYFRKPITRYESDRLYEEERSRKRRGY